MEEEKERGIQVDVIREKMSDYPESILSLSYDVISKVIGIKVM